MKKIFLLLAFFSFFTFKNADAQVIWDGPDIAFSKAANADWTDPLNIDSITPMVSFTRQTNRQIYNYTYWQLNFAQDITSDDLGIEF